MANCLKHISSNDKEIERLWMQKTGGILDLSSSKQRKCGAKQKAVWWYY